LQKADSSNEIETETMKQNTKERMENQRQGSDMIPVQKIHGEQNGELISRIWQNKIRR
jgi:hypothetical protein